MGIAIENVRNPAARGFGGFSNLRVSETTAAHDVDDAIVQLASHFNLHRI